MASLSVLLDQIVESGRSLIGRAWEGGRGAPLDPITACEVLLTTRGEATGVALAREIAERLETAGPDERTAFLRALAVRFGADPRKLSAAVETWLRTPSPATESALHFAAEPRRQEVIRRLNQGPRGTAALVGLRGDLLELLGEGPHMEALDRDFAHLFASWFNRGFLVVRRIDWTSPANVLEKIIAYEAVHEIRDWNDLRNRLEPPDRRCFAFFHPRLVDEPLIFVEVALTRGLPDAVQPLLDLKRTPLDPKQATTAVFYSISNTQKGLRGVTFGNFLIKQVVEELKRDLPQLTTFTTLSPVPGFAAWLAKERTAAEPRPSATILEALRDTERAGWTQDAAAVEALRKPLAQAAAHYLAAAKTASGRPVDPVARFHLGNGARLERVLPLGDVSAKGIAESHSVMVNYVYDLDDIEKNHEAFAARGDVAMSSAVRRLAAG